MIKLTTAFGLILVIFASVPAQAFELSFDWENLPLCTNGIPNTVPNPTFTITDIPTGTRYISFKLVDQNAPSYRHGGGIVQYTGQTVINSGEFEYKSPCPPSGQHTYTWRASAKSTPDGETIAVAKASVKYP